MKDRRPGLNARTMTGVIAAAACAAAAIVLVVGRGHEAPGGPIKEPIRGVESATTKPQGSAANSPTQAKSGFDPKPVITETLAVAAAPPSKSTPPTEPHAPNNSLLPEEEWLPNPEEDFGEEDAYFEERYGEPTPELIRSSLARALQEQDPDRNWTEQEKERAGNALVRLRQLRLAMRALEFTPENAEQRQALVAETKTVMAEFQDVTGAAPSGLLAPAPPAPAPSKTGSRDAPRRERNELPVGPDDFSTDSPQSSSDDFLQGQI